MHYVEAYLWKYILIDTNPHQIHALPEQDPEVANCYLNKIRRLLPEQDPEVATWTRFGGCYLNKIRIAAGESGRWRRRGWRALLLLLQRVLLWYHNTHSVKTFYSIRMGNAIAKETKVYVGVKHWTATCTRGRLAGGVLHLLPQHNEYPSCCPLKYSMTNPRWSSPLVLFHVFKHHPRFPTLRTAVVT